MESVISELSFHIYGHMKFQILKASLRVHTLPSVTGNVSHIELGILRVDNRYEIGILKRCVGGGATAVYGAVFLDLYLTFSYIKLTVLKLQYISPKI